MTLPLAGSVAHQIYQAMARGMLLLPGKPNLYLLWSIPVVILLIDLSLSLYCWKLKEIKELTPEAKSKKEEFHSRWYVSAALLLPISFVSYFSYIEGIRMPGVAILLFNPVIGIIAAIVAIFRAWELSLIAIIGVILYFIYLGIAALPVSIAIIIGSIIISYGFYKYKR